MIKKKENEKLRNVTGRIPRTNMITRRKRSCVIHHCGARAHKHTKKNVAHIYARLTA